MQSARNYCSCLHVYTRTWLISCDSHISAYVFIKARIKDEGITTWQFKTGLYNKKMMDHVVKAIPNSSGVNVLIGQKLLFDVCVCVFCKSLFRVIGPWPTYSLSPAWHTPLRTAWHNLLLCKLVVFKVIIYSATLQPEPKDTHIAVYPGTHFTFKPLGWS